MISQHPRDDVGGHGGLHREVSIMLVCGLLSHLPIRGILTYTFVVFYNCLHCTIMCRRGDSMRGRAGSSAEVAIHEQPEQPE